HASGAGAVQRPRRRLALEPGRPRGDRQDGAAGGRGLLSLFPPPSQARILLADDNADMRDYVTRLLRGRWSVETVDDGATALARAWETLPDLILSDIMMPGLDGPDALRVLVVDDNEDAADLLVTSVRLMGHLARVAHDGPTALRIAADFQPQVALSDRQGTPGSRLARRRDS